jgi:hypothetical protein
VAPRKAPRPTAAGTARKPRVDVSAGRRKRPKAKIPDPSTQVGFLAVYDGRSCIGHLLPRGKLGVEAFDRGDKSLGVFPNLKSAADAVSKRARGAT